MRRFFSRLARKAQIKRGRTRSVRLQVRGLEERCCPSGGTVQWADPIPFTNSASEPYRVLAQPSGKIILAGGTSSGNTPCLALVQLNGSGGLDVGFGSGGTVSTSKSGAPTVLFAAALYPTGTSGDLKILVAGPGASSAFALARYNANGSLDTSFGKGGVVDTSFTQGTGACARVGAGARDGVVLVPNGTALPKIVMAGSDANNAGIELARYNPDGSLDTSFGSKGTAYVPINGGISLGALARDSVTGDLLVAGQNGDLVAFQPNGTLDTLFGTGGMANTGADQSNAPPTNTLQMALAVYPATDANGNAGKILIGGRGSGIARYTASGVLDTSWGGTGTVPTSAQGLAVQADDKIVAASGLQWTVTRLNTDGSLDSTFGTGGVASAGLQWELPFNYDVTILPNGDIVEIGTAPQPVRSTIYGSCFGAALFLPSEPEIGSFMASQFAAGAPVALTASNITDGNPNSTISQVTFYYYDSSGNKITVGTVTAPDGSGNWTLSASLPPGNYTLYAQATDSYGVLGDPLAYSLTVQ
ncbi:MAG TPA: hypothetical protein VFA18_14340 [Gemmataceae bacterium]|nr:hypothetical protein [Gemmataceae bacterium]